MKIGILTYHTVFNCGAILQSYALKKVLENYGHEVCYINYVHNIHWKPMDFIGKPSRYYRIYQIIRYGYFNHFNDILSNFTKRYRSLKSLQKDPPDCDVYIVGSDQVWNWIFYVNDDEARIFYLDFGNNRVKRISYAASLGDAKIPPQKISLFCELIKKIGVISVREYTSEKKITDIDKNIEVRVNEDPTSLLSKDDYIRCFNLKTQNNNNLVTYLIHDVEQIQKQYILDFIEKRKLTHVNLVTPEYGVKFKRNNIVKPIEWLNYMISSEYIISNSFHGIMFAIIFNKKFLAFDYSPSSGKRNDRLFSLLRLLGLENRLVTSDNLNMYDKVMNEDIDWVRVNDIMKKKREYNIKSLISSVNV